MLLIIGIILIVSGALMWSKADIEAREEDLADIRVSEIQQSITDSVSVYSEKAEKLNKEIKELYEREVTKLKKKKTRRVINCPDGSVIAEEIIEGEENE